MKLAFSTLGCPDWGLDQIIECAKAFGYAGVELRGLLSEFNLVKRIEFNEKERVESRKKFDDAGIEVACVSCSARLGLIDDKQSEAQLDDGKAHIELAALLGAKVVRVFGGNRPEELSRRDHIELVASRFRSLCEFAKSESITVAIETHDDFCLGADIARVLENVDVENAGCVWDFHNSFRAGESIEESVKVLSKSWIAAVHAKDSLQVNGSLRHVCVGEGDVPVQPAVELLNSLGFEGFVSFEWEKSWHNELSQPEEVLPLFPSVMRGWGAA